MDLDDGGAVLEFVCVHMQVSKTLGCQKQSITTGSSLGGTIFGMVLMVHEMRFCNEQGPLRAVQALPNSSFWSMRFMDDIRVFIVSPLKKNRTICAQLP